MPWKFTDNLFSGSNDYDEAKEYIKTKFTKLNKKKEKQIYSHFTCATDTSNINHVFNVITADIIEKNVNNMAIF